MAVGSGRGRQGETVTQGLQALVAPGRHLTLHRRSRPGAPIILTIFKRPVQWHEIPPRGCATVPTVCPGLLPLPVCTSW